MPRGRKKVQDPAMARRILAAAERHFAEQGLAGDRTEEIATDARANKAMLYYYFGDKNHLHRAVLENLLRQFRSKVLAPSAKGISASKRFFNYLNEYFDFLAAYPNYPRLVQREAMEPSGKFEWMASEFFRPLHREVARAVEESVAAAEFRPVDPDQTALIALQMTVSYFAAAAITSRVVGRDLLAPDAVAARKRVLFDFLEHGLKAEEKRVP
jgi:TetR/AcrR family transcriptional regulator